MRVLILGHTGFAGGYLWPELEAHGHEVWGASRRESSDPRHLRCDLEEPGAIEATLDACAPDAVFLLGGVASPPEAHADPERAYRVHALGAVRLLEAAARRDAALRVMFVTSSEIYGSVAPEELPVTETTALNPNSIYAASKAAADLAARAFSLTKDCDVVRLRPFNHTGPGQRPQFVCPDFAMQVAAIAAGQHAPEMEVGDLEVDRDFTDVRDIVRGYALALEKGASGGVYNLCSGRRIRIRSILDDLCSLGGVSPTIQVAAARQRKAQVPAYWGSFARAEGELGWRPEIPWERTLSDLYRWAEEEVAGRRPTARTAT